MWCAGTIVLCRSAEFQFRSTSCPLVMAIKPEAKENVCPTTMLLFYIIDTQKYYHNESYTFFDDFLSYVNSLL
jgi:hypothetical protein